MRVRISTRLAAIWLVVVVPLSLVLAATFFQWYQAQVALVAQQRMGYAELSGSTFSLIIQHAQATMRESGTEIARVGAKNAASTREMQRAAALYPAAYVAFADISGKVLNATDPKVIGTQAVAPATFQEALAAATGSAIGPSQLAHDGSVGFPVMQAVDMPPGKPSGVMVMFIGVKELRRMFPVSVPTGGVSIIDSAGQVVYQNEIASLAEQRANWGAQFDIVRTALSGTPMTATNFVFPGGGTRIGAFVPIAPFGWAAGSSVSAGVALATFYDSLRVQIPIAALLGTAALLASIFIARGINRALVGLDHDAQRIGSGDLSRPVTTLRDDEIGDVARSLEEARVNLERSQEEARDAREQAERQLETTQLLLNAANALAQWTDSKKLLESLAGVILQSTEHTRAFVFVWDEDARTLTQAASEGKEAFVPGTVFDYENLSQATKDSIDNLATVLVDFDALDGDRRGRALSERESHLMLSVPVVWQDKLVAALGVDDPGERRQFTAHEVEVIEGIGAQAAVAIENARLLEAQARGRELADALNRVDQAVHATLSAEEIVDTVTVLATDALAVDSSRIVVCIDDEWVTRGGHNVPRQMMKAPPLPNAEVPFFVAALRGRETLAASDARNDDRLNPKTVKRFDIGSSLVAPLRVPGLEGVLVFNTFGAKRVFGQPEIQFATQVASSLGLAMANAQLYEAERGIAETLQTALLALPEHIPGVEFATCYYSASETARVGGDFYDMFELEDDRIGITIGDISGHGIEAAVLTSLVKNAIRVQATQEDKSPNEVMASASEVLYSGSATEIFATAFFGVLDMRTGQLEYCNAGHTTGAVICSGDCVRHLSTNSPLLGAFPETPFTLSAEEVGPNDVVFLYTDGLTEARRDGRLFGETRLFELLDGLHGIHPQKAVERVTDAVFEYTGGTLTDDLAVLALQLVGRER